MVSYSQKCVFTHLSFDNQRQEEISVMEDNHDNKGASYLRFFAMIGTSMLVMYFLTYLNSFQILDHAWFSETRLFMTMLMGGSMMAIMLSFMLGMYKNRNANVAIFVGAAVMMLLSVWLVRSQITVDGVDYMEAMIPHHSIAILTSERAGIEDPRVHDLSIRIIEAQRKEIKEMEWLIEDIRTNGLAETQEEAEARPVPDFSAAPE
jgi:hypothetical protein